MSAFDPNRTSRANAAIRGLSPIGYVCWYFGLCCDPHKLGRTLLLQSRTKGMESWNNPEWLALCSGAVCPICRRGMPDGIVWELASSYLTSTANAAMRGYCCVVLKRHAVELHELSDDEIVAFTRDVQRVGKAIQKLTRAVKLNYEIHGNTIPHLHMHIYPRQRGDPFEGGPIDPRRIKSSPYRANEFETFVAELRTSMAVG
jgi:diadenosine tetraphosphate (Ap4A) HIT family hydrolase